MTPEIQAEMNALARRVATEIGEMLGQEYRWLQGAKAGRWWLYSLGEPQRPLTAAEIQEAALPEKDG